MVQEGEVEEEGEEEEEEDHVPEWSGPRGCRPCSRPCTISQWQLPLPIGEGGGGEEEEEGVGAEGWKDDNRNRQRPKEVDCSRIASWIDIWYVLVRAAGIAS